MTNAIIRLMLVLAVLVSLSLVDARKRGSGRACRLGTRKGKKVATEMWNELGKDCDSGFGVRANKMAGNKFRNKRNASQNKQRFNDCAKKAVQEKIADIEEACNDRTPCEKGTEAGDQAAADLWDGWKENCDKAPWFEEWATDMANKKFRNERRATPTDKSFNDCAKKAVERKIADVERECDSETPCDEGTEAGKQEATRMWDDLGEDCGEAWGFADRATDMAKKRFRSNRRTSQRQRAFNVCANEAVERMITEVETECLGETTEQCEEVGKMAAQLIVTDEVCPVAKGLHMAGDWENDSSWEPPDYPKECREYAVPICKASIESTIEEYCEEELDDMKTSELNELAEECKDKVEYLTN